MNSFSPGSKKRVRRRLKCTSSPFLRKTLRLDRVKMQSQLLKEIIDFLNSNGNTVVPDKKKQKKELRYQLPNPKTLWRKFSSVINCSYAQFTRYVPPNIIKPVQKTGAHVCVCCSLTRNLSWRVLRGSFPKYKSL